MNVPQSVAPPHCSTPVAPPPPGSCDAHSHVFGPFGVYPPKHAAVYALPDATPGAHAVYRSALGCTRGVLTQPAPYGDDPSAMLAAISASAGALRGVGVAGAGTSDETLARWSDEGIVGLRFTEKRAPNGERYPGSVGFDDLVALAPRLRRHGLHAQVWADLEDHLAWMPRLLELGIPLVYDHMASPRTSEGASTATFNAFCELAARNDQCWIKLVLCRVGEAALDYADAREFHDRFVETMGERCVWGSDWPYVRLSPSPDAARLLTLFQAWVPDARTQHQILVANPNKLYGWRS